MPARVLSTRTWQPIVLIAIILIRECTRTLNTLGLLTDVVVEVGYQKIRLVPAIQTRETLRETEQVAVLATRRRDG